MLTHSVKSNNTSIEDVEADVTRYKRTINLAFKMNYQLSTVIDLIFGLVINHGLAFIENVASRVNGTLIWVIGSQFEGNERADEVAGLGTSLDLNFAEQAPYLQL